MATSSRGEKPHTVQPQSAACESTLAPGSTVAQHHLRLLLPRDNPPFRPRSWCFGDPTKEKEQLRNSLLSDRSRGKNSRRPQGMRRTPPVSAHVCRCGARAALTRSTGLTSRANGLRAARVCAARAASVFTALAPALCAHQAGALPRKFRRSSCTLAQHRCHRPQSPAPLTRTTRRSQYLQCLTQSRERLFPALSALYSPLALPPALLLHVHRCARSQLITQQRTAHQPLRVFCASNTRNAQAPASPVFQPHCANAAPHRCSQSACSAFHQAAPTPILQFNGLSSSSAIARINFSLFCWCLFCLIV
jgi:hypothetical protein